MIGYSIDIDDVKASQKTVISQTDLSHLQTSNNTNGRALPYSRCHLL